MTIKSSFARALRKTLKQGYIPLKGYKVVSFASIIREEHGYVDLRVVKPDDESKKQLRAHISINDILFDPEFARLLWGEEYVYNRDYALVTGVSAMTALINHGADGVAVDGDLEYMRLLAWQYHLQQVVILPTTTDRLKYLGENL